MAERGRAGAKRKLSGAGKVFEMNLMASSRGQIPLVIRLSTLLSILLKRFFSINFKIFWLLFFSHCGIETRTFVPLGHDINLLHLCVILLF